jgi:hypothetical protein
MSNGGGGRVGENRRQVLSAARRAAQRKRAELEGLHAVLRRAAERAERSRRVLGDKSSYTDEEVEQLASAVADLADELAAPSFTDRPFGCPLDEAE